MKPTAADAVRMAREAGFARAALVPARVLTGYVPNAEAVRHGIEGDPFRVLENAKSVLVAMRGFRWFSAWPQGCGEVAAYYFHSNAAYAAIRGVAALLREGGAQAEDSQKIPAKAWATLAGFGAPGRNALLHATGFGTCLTLQTLLTDIEPDETRASLPDVPRLIDAECGACRRCVDACPTGALDGRGGLDPARCLRAFQLRGETAPEEMREKQGVRFLGCEICQRVCPRNAAVSPLPPPCPETFALEKLLRFEGETRERARAILGANYARLRRVLAQALIAAGNSGETSLLPLVEALRGHEAPAIAAHADWACARLRAGN